MIKKLLLTFFFVTLITITFSGTTYAAQEGEKIIVSEELIKLNNLYKEGVITEEEFSKAKSILLNLDPDSDTSYISETTEITKSEKKKKKKYLKKLKKARTAAERKRLKEREEERLLSVKKAKIEEKKAEKIRIREERDLERELCLDNPESEACKTTVFQALKNITDGMNRKEREKKEAKELENELEKQASLERTDKIKAKKAAKKAEQKKTKKEKSTIFKTLKKMF